MRRVFAAFGFFALAGALSLSFILIPAAPLSASDQTATFLIPASDGYGIAQCLLTGDACGEIVAAAWCEAHGYARAEAFGAAARDRQSPLSITCSD